MEWQHTCPDLLVCRLSRLHCYPCGWSRDRDDSCKATADGSTRLGCACSFTRWLTFLYQCPFCSHWLQKHASWLPTEDRQTIALRSSSCKKHAHAWHIMAVLQYYHECPAHKVATVTLLLTVNRVLAASMKIHPDWSEKPLTPPSPILHMKYLHKYNTDKTYAITNPSVIVCI